MDKRGSTPLTLINELYNLKTETELRYAPPGPFSLSQLRAATIRRDYEQQSSRQLLLRSGEKVVIPHDIDRKKHPEALEELLALARSHPCGDCIIKREKCEQCPDNTWKCCRCETLGIECAWKAGKWNSLYEV